MTSFGDEPDLALGDSGEAVTHLQTRLNGIGLYDGALDGRFGDSTEKSVALLQVQRGIAGTGLVDSQTWQELGQAEQGTGMAAPAAKPHLDGLTTEVGALSEDQHWRWDGEHWQANEERSEPIPVVALAGGGGHLSADGQWLWDGNQWQPLA